MLFVSNHDHNAWEGTEFEKFGDALDAAIVLSVVGEGMPLIYNGQEAGNDRRLAFFEKDPIEWREHPQGELYRRLFALKKANTALWNARLGRAHGPRAQQRAEPGVQLRAPQRAGQGLRRLQLLGPARHRSASRRACITATTPTISGRSRCNWTQRRRWRWPPGAIGCLCSSFPSYFNIGVACTDAHLDTPAADRVAMVVEDEALGVAQLSYRELAELTSRFAQALRELGVDAGERVLIRLPNHIAYPVVFLGSIKRGAIPVPSSILLTAEEVSWLLDDASGGRAGDGRAVVGGMGDPLCHACGLRHVVLVSRDSSGADALR